MEQMVTVINRLSEIEAAAVNLEKQSADKKRRIAREYEEKTLNFDREIEAETTEKLRMLNEKLKREAEEELLKLKKGTEKALAAMEKEYDEHHAELAEKLFHEIIGE
jgi:hypothetical protein